MTTPELTAAAGDSTVRQVFDAVVEVLMHRGRVEIDGVGEFALCQRKARTARNPRTGERINVPAKVAVKFTPANALKRRTAQLPAVPGSNASGN